MTGTESILALLAVVDRIATVAADWAQKESYTDAQKQVIEDRIENSRKRVDDIFAKLDEEPPT